jgi:dolichyl-phosphate beta-glucosyltransferase
LSATVIVVPCYNEARRLPVARYEKFLRESDVGFVFVDDGSTDETPERLRGIARAAPERAEVLCLPRNAGKAEAVRAGVLRAFGRRPDYVGYWDADLAAPLSAIVDLGAVLEARGEVELVMGARVVLLGREIERSAFRHYLGRVAATVISLTLGLRVYDTQCGAKLFRCGDEMRAIFEEPFVARWLFDVEILARLVAACGDGARQAIVEVPLTRWVDVPGSKLGPLDYLHAAVDLLKLSARRWPRGRDVAPAPRH